MYTAGFIRCSERVSSMRVLLGVSPGWLVFLSVLPYTMCCAVGDMCPLDNIDPYVREIQYGHI